MADNGTTSRNSMLQLAAVTVAAVAAVGAGIWFGYTPAHPPTAPARQIAPQASAPAAPPPAKEAISPAPARAPAAVATAPPAPAAQPPAVAPVTAPASPPAAPVAAAPGKQPPAVAATVPPPAPPAAAPKTEESAIKPSFDIVRVNPQGGVVLAGRAAPGAEVTVAKNGYTIGTTTADSAGEWVLLPQKPIGSGSSELTVASREPNRKPVEGEAPVVILMPDHSAAPPAGASTSAPAAAAPSAPVVVLTPNEAVPKLLQAPAAPTDIPRGKLGLATVDYDDRGAIRFAGNAPPGATVRTYIDNKPVGEAAADDKGHWTLVPQDPVAVGDHQLRLDQLGKGRVTARIELPFQRAELSPQAIAPGSVVVQPGQNLWRIARHTYGRGIQYVVIYQANREQIRDPNLIYPGQVFAMPANQKPSATP